MHKLIFTMDLAKSQELIYGNLQLVYPNRQPINYIATSGCAGWQRLGDEWVRGKGPIPAGEYQIPIEPYYLETRGIEGDFFHRKTSRKPLALDMGRNVVATYLVALK